MPAVEKINEKMVHKKVQRENKWSGSHCGIKTKSTLM